MWRSLPPFGEIDLMDRKETAEQQRLKDKRWQKWGPYLSERAWGTVREDYSASGEAWEYFPHDHARSRAYRWNEDGIGGVCDDQQTICMALAFWNGRDPILKERFFGLTGNEGNHGEDVKEIYFYLDNTPTHSYMKMLYKYPQAEFPYADLVAENGRRPRQAFEYELLDSLHEAFEQGRYFDITIEYAKADAEDILCRVTAVNRGPDPAPLHILPHLWYRNTWSWGDGGIRHPISQATSGRRNRMSETPTAYTNHPVLGERWWSVDSGALMFTENESNKERLWGAANDSTYVKDGIHEAVVNGRHPIFQRNRMSTTNPDQGSKVAAHCTAVIPPGGSFTIRARFNNQQPIVNSQQSTGPFVGFDAIFEQRIAEADEFYAAVQPPALSGDERNVQRQAFAGLLWSKQFYHYHVQKWLDGDPAGPPPPDSRKYGRNRDWFHLDNADVISMPDKWEYPWYATWDTAFHMIPMALIDPDFAKAQLILFLREWYMHPNGQLPAYEWALGDANPPVHAWACWRVYKIDRNIKGRADAEFLERVFHKLLLNFTWWVNRKDADGNNVFQGGFLGLDNIGVFDRSAPLPTGGHMEQADGTAWMGMYCLNMMAIALELSRTKPAYEDVATKFFEHFIYIANAINKSCGEQGLWDEKDGFYYDMVHTPDGRFFPLKIRSLIGLIPLFAVETLEPEALDALPNFRGRMEWFIENRPDLARNIHSLIEPGVDGRRLLSLVNQEQLTLVLKRMLDPGQFLSDYGLRSLSKRHEAEPFALHLDGRTYTVRYEPAESQTGMFGGNSNWRGPIWFPVNYLMIESLQKYAHYCGDAFKVQLPRRSGNWMTLDEAAADLSGRLVRLFLRGGDGRRPIYGGLDIFQNDPHWRDHILFYEYFHGDNGAGLGASHQTGWTALVAKLIQYSGKPPVQAGSG